MDLVYRMLKESRQTSNATAGMAANDDDADAKVGGLTVDEKLFLQAVDRGDTERMRRYVELVRHAKTPVKGFNINCVDSLGRFAVIVLSSSLNCRTHNAQDSFIS